MNKLKNINFLNLLLAIVTVRSLLEINVPQSLVFISLVGFAAYMKWREDNKKLSITDEMKKDLETLKTNVSGIMIKNASRPETHKPEIRW